MAAILIDGKAEAAALRARVAAEAALLPRAPGLAVVLVGEDPASQVYVRSKLRQTVEAGMRSFEHRLPASVTERDLLALIDRLNADDDVDGILVQLPLPPHIGAEAVLSAIDPAKDVDGFHAVNVGRLASGLDAMVPCTPMGAMLLLSTVLDDLSGLDAVILGRSNIVGKPMLQLLLQRDCSVTLLHSRSRDIAARCAKADIVIAAVGRAELVRGDWVRPGAVVIDVGINRIETDGKPKLVGDVAFDEVASHARAITPVPGGVGPMTIACLLANSLEASRRRQGLASDA